MSLIGLGARVPVWTPFYEEQLHQAKRHDYFVGEIFSGYKPSSTVDTISVTRKYAGYVRRAWPKLAQGKRQRKARLALGRWARANNPQSFLEDRLMDAWIGLEALFTENEQELALKASLRIAQFLCGKRQKRSEIIQSLRKSYAVRSRVAHGENLRDSDELSGCVRSTSEILRAGLQRLFFSDVDIETFSGKNLEDELIQASNR